MIVDKHLGGKDETMPRALNNVSQVVNFDIVLYMIMKVV